MALLELSATPVPSLECATSVTKAIILETYKLLISRLSLASTAKRTIPLAVLIAQNLNVLNVRLETGFIMEHATTVPSIQTVWSATKVELLNAGLVIISK